MKSWTCTPASIYSYLVNLQYFILKQVGSLENFYHQPGGGNFEVLHKPLNLKKVKSKVGSLDNSKHIPQGGKKKIPQQSVSFVCETQLYDDENLQDVCWLARDNSQNWRILCWCLSMGQILDFFGLWRLVMVWF
mgnify:FL=1